mmetsp:Transcript_14220/g.41816  ORF Transcript_14220/g.41816 Transcript_14220/m.41816 type:complete len:298 (-) Transcript_14220:1365-2258(-)
MCSSCVLRQALRGARRLEPRRHPRTELPGCGAAAMDTGLSCLDGLPLRTPDSASTRRPDRLSQAFARQARHKPLPGTPVLSSWLSRAGLAAAGSLQVHASAALARGVVRLDARSRPEAEEEEVEYRHAPEEENEATQGAHHPRPVAVEVFFDGVGHLEGYEAPRCEELRHVASDHLQPRAEDEVGAHPQGHGVGCVLGGLPRGDLVEDAALLLLDRVLRVHLLVPGQLLELLAVLLRSVLDEIGARDETRKHHARGDREGEARQRLPDAALGLAQLEGPREGDGEDDDDHGGGAEDH